jgi:hypothetical protein
MAGAAWRQVADLIEAVFDHGRLLILLQTTETSIAMSNEPRQPRRSAGSRSRPNPLAALAAIGVILGSSPPVEAHHSFAVHYVGERTVTVSGVVRAFRFRNPHGMILLETTSVDGAPVEWKIETNSPNILRRRGWTPDSLVPGDEVSITGYPARDGSNSMRVYRIEFADGHELIGQRPAAGVER